MSRLAGTGYEFPFLSPWERIKARALSFERKTKHGTLRKYSTIAERRLWFRLRNSKAAGLKFRRQHPIGNRVVDFFCEEAKLAVELDGSGHRRHFGEYEDLDRELDLYEKGMRVLRFSNKAVLLNLDRVVNEIIYAVAPERSFWSTTE